MGISGEVALAAAKKYTAETVIGGGAIKGKNCIIKSISEITGGHRVTFEWTLDDGTVQTQTMDVMDGEGTNSYAGKNVVHMGDSIIDLYHVAEKSAALAGYNVTNVGFQATAFTDKMSLITNSKYYSLKQLVNSMANNDWSAQDNHTNSNYTEHLATLKAIDWSEVDILILSYGTNDYGCQAYLCDTYAKDDTSVEGVIKKAVKYFKTANPNMEIIITTPIYRINIDAYVSAVGQQNIVFEQYRNEIALTASSLGIKVIDLYALSGIDQYNASATLSDGLHPNTTGQDMWAAAFVSALSSGYVGAIVNEPTEHNWIENMQDNLIFDSEIYKAHHKTNATFQSGQDKFLCAAGDDANSEVILYTRPYSNLSAGKKFHFQAICKSTTQDAHRLGVRFYSNEDHEDKLDKYMEFTSQTTAFVDFTTSEAYSNVVAVFYVRNMTAFDTSQALTRRAYATIT